MTKFIEHHAPSAKAQESINALQEQFAKLNETIEATSIRSEDKAIALSHLKIAGVFAICAVASSDTGPAAEPKAEHTTDVPTDRNNAVGRHEGPGKRGAPKRQDPGAKEP